MLWVADGFLAIVSFRISVLEGHTFAVTLEGTGFGTGETVQETPFVDLVTDFARDRKETRHRSLIMLSYG